jgi:hypothetical protein
MNPWDLNRPVIQLTTRDELTLGQLSMSLLILGATGSGKTSASARLILTTLMSQGCGGLFLTVKPGDAELIRGYAREVGREPDVILVRPDGPWRFDLLRYECQRPGAGGGQTENILRLLTRLVAVSDQGSGATHDQDSGFWKRALAQLIRNAIEVVKSATGTVRLADLYNLVRTTAQSPADLESALWREGSPGFRMLLAAEQRADLSQAQRRDLEPALQYFLGEWPRLAEKTRSVIELSFTGLIDLFQRGFLRDLFCSGETNFLPEYCERGALIVLDFPLKEWGDVARIGQSAVRFVFQAAMERRVVTETARPIILAIDEAQNFLSVDDALFLTTARSARVVTVLISQNLPVLGAALGQGEAGTQVAEAVLATIGTKIFHAQACQRTNQWAADLIAKSWQPRVQVGTGGAPSQDAYALRRNLQQQTSNASVADVFEYTVPPAEFTTLRMPGPERVSEAIVVQAGRRWSHGGNALRVLFPQS